MPRFTALPVEEVAPKRRNKQPSVRAQVQQQYQNELHTAVVHNHQALVIELEPEDKPLTVRNRIKRAAQSLGVDDLVIRRRGNRIAAYRSDEGQGGE